MILMIEKKLSKYRHNQRCCKTQIFYQRTLNQFCSHFVDIILQKTLWQFNIKFLNDTMFYKIYIIFLTPMKIISSSATDQVGEKASPSTMSYLYQCHQRFVQGLKKLTNFCDHRFALFARRCHRHFAQSLDSVIATRTRIRTWLPSFTLKYEIFFLFFIFFSHQKKLFKAPTKLALSLKKDAMFLQRNRQKRVTCWF